MVLAAGDVTEFLSIDLTTIIATLLNTLILFLVLKHFLFDKVNKVIEDRKNDVKETYRQADEAKENAEKLEAEYTSRLEGAKEESAQIIQTATRKAQQRSDEIISEARTEAKGLVDNASREIEREKKIAVNQINLIFGESFSSLGMIMDEYEDFTAAKYQAVHHEFVANALLVRAAKAIDPQIQIGVMLADQMTYPLNSDPKACEQALEANRMKDYFYSDVQLRGEYPGYAKRYFKEHHITIRMEPGDAELIKENTMDFLAVAYYYSHCVDASGKKVANPFTKATQWGWTIDPTGLYIAMSSYWDRYHVPMMIAENGIGVEETLDSEGQIHDDYRIAYHREHIAQMRKLIEDEVELFAYTLWSPFDIVSGNSCEMEKRYGLIYVDVDNNGQGTRKLVKKDSYAWFQHVIETDGAEL